MSDKKNPVRVGRFEWERLMLMTVPHPTNFKLLPIGVFMSADGSRVRPGNAGLALFGPHEKTWAKLLRWAVSEGWLIQVSRGGARRGPNGTTIVRASVYAASVPQDVWERRMEILGAPPFRTPGLEGSAPDPLKGAPGDSPEGLKGAPDGSSEAPDSLKGAPETPFNAPDPSMKGAPRDSLPESLKGAPGVFEGSDPSFEGSVSGFEGSAQTLPHHVVPPSRSDSSSTSSTTVAAEDSSRLPAAAGEAEGGGGEVSESRSIAEQIVAALDYRGQWPDKRLQKTLTDRLTAALDSGWTVEALAGYLNLNGASVDSPAAVYAHRLKPGVLPAPPPQLPPPCDDHAWIPGADTDPSKRVDPLGDPCPKCNPAAVGGSGSGQQDTAGGMWDRAMARAQARTLNGTDATVLGWLDLAGQSSTSDQRVRQAIEAGQRVQRQLGGHKPYTNEPWVKPADPEKAAKIPHCGDPNCDPVTRLKTEPAWDGTLCTSICENCHPSMHW